LDNSNFTFNDTSRLLVIYYYWVRLFVWLKFPVVSHVDFGAFDYIRVKLAEIVLVSLILVISFGMVTVKIDGLIGKSYGVIVTLNVIGIF
jgi:hypothetical protein